MADLEELYREIILDHYRSPRNRGELPSPPAHRVEGFNPLCGDEVVVTLLVEDGTLADIKIAGTGCSISQSSASLMSGAVKGRPLDEVHRLIRTFKSMMSIHEASLGSDAAGEGEARSGNGTAGAGEGEARSGNGTAGAGEGTPAAGDAEAASRPGGESLQASDDEPEAVDRESLGELAALQGVVKFPVRIKCATLSWNALSQGLRELEAG